MEFDAVWFMGFFVFGICVLWCGNVVSILEVGQVIIPHDYIEYGLDVNSACEFLVHVRFGMWSFVVVA